MADKKERAVQRVKKAYLVGLQYDWIWDVEDVKLFIQHFAELKKQGIGARETVAILAERFKRKPSEVAILIIDLGDNGKIDPYGNYDLNMGRSRGRGT